MVIMYVYDLYIFYINMYIQMYLYFEILTYVFVVSFCLYTQGHPQVAFEKKPELP